MLRSINAVFGSLIHATDGELGKVCDVLFDDRGWTVRYLIVETGDWLARRQVLIAPAAAGKPDWDNGMVPVELTMEQVRNSPDIDTAKPVSLQEETEMNLYYGWPTYWPGMYPPPIPDPNSGRPDSPDGDPHLRSVKEISTYLAHAADGELGKIDHLLMEDANWFIRYLVVSTGSWLSGQQLLVATRWVGSISWSDKQIVLTESREDL